MGAFEIAGAGMVGFLGGLVPGVHINSLVLILQNLHLAIPLVLGAAAAGHRVADFIPSMLLGAPSEELSLSLQPAQRMIGHGRGQRALLAGMYGAVIGTLAFIILLPATVFVIPHIYSTIGRGMGIFLILLSAILVLTERKKAAAAAIFLLAGIMGLVVLRSYLPSSTKLFLMLTGCYGFSSLLLSLFSKSKVPKQLIKPEVGGRVIQSSLIGTLSGFMVGTFPAVSCSQTLVLTSPFMGSDEEFVAAASSANITSILFSAATLYAIGKARNGIMAAFGHMDLLGLLIFCSSFLVVLLPAVMATICLGNIVLKFLEKWQKPLAILVSASLLMAAFLLSGPYGLLVFLTSASLGLLVSSLGIRRGEAMGMLLIPTILFYLSLGS